MARSRSASLGEVGGTVVTSHSRMRGRRRFSRSPILVAMDVDSGVDVARRLAATLAGRGARAVCLVGSVARGDAHPASDIDLIALGSDGAGPAHVLQRHHDRLVSISWRTPEQVRAAFTSPPDVGGAVPA